MEVGDGLLAMLAGDVVGNVGHRAGPVEGDDGGDVLEACGLHLPEQLTHRPALQLEHAD